LAWLDDNPDRPFFAFLNYFDAHDPYLPPAPFHETYGPRNGDERRLLVRWGEYAIDRVQPTSEQVDVAQRAYDGCIAYLDQQLGLLVERLERRGDLENTLIIITSDHGEGFGEHGNYNHATSLYQEQIHVPLLIRFPGRVPAGRRIAGPVSLRDIPATVLDILEEETPALPGRSLARCWSPLGSPEDAPPVLSELEPLDCIRRSPHDFLAKSPLMALRSDNVKYIRQKDHGVEEVFDLATDPREERNLAGRAGHQAAMDRFRQAYVRLANPARQVVENAATSTHHALPPSSPR
jgi:arylsulfatase A-like enzyme